jgi:hypothetical protein
MFPTITAIVVVAISLSELESGLCKDSRARGWKTDQHGGQCHHTSLSKRTHGHLLIGKATHHPA